jgi:hypothetical protein
MHVTSPVRFATLAVILSLPVACATRGELRPQRTPPSVVDEGQRPTLMRRLLLGGLTPVALTLSTVASAPLQALQQLDGQRQDRPVVRRRIPSDRRAATAFVRTELYFGTAKPVGAVTDEEFKAFLDAVVTPLFPDGLTVVKADGQFKGEDGLTIKEQSYVLILLYPVEGHKVSSRNIDAIRQAYMAQHQQQSVLRVDDPFLVWVSF